MIWAQFEESPGFEKLCLQLREAFPTEEKRKPNPHATLARIKRLKRLPFELPQGKTFSFVADRIELWESKLSSEGSQYQMLESWKLS
jgi:2'-5' RNA ligase